MYPGSVAVAVSVAVPFPSQIRVDYSVKPPPFLATRMGTLFRRRGFLVIKVRERVCCLSFSLFSCARLGVLRIYFVYL